MWLFAYESVRNETNPNTNRAFIEHDPFFSLLLSRNINFFDPYRGFESMDSMLRGRMAENVRANTLRRNFLEYFNINLLEFDEDEAFDELNTYFEGEY